MIAPPLERDVLGADGFTGTGWTFDPDDADADLVASVHDAVGVWRFRRVIVDCLPVDFQLALTARPIFRRDCFGWQERGKGAQERFTRICDELEVSELQQLGL